MSRSPRSDLGEVFGDEAPDALQQQRLGHAHGRIGFEIGERVHSGEAGRGERCGLEGRRTAHGDHRNGCRAGGSRDAERGLAAEALRVEAPPP